MDEFEKLISVDGVLEQERKNRQALLILLDKERERRDHLFAVDARMGTTRSFVTTATLEWVARRVRFATEMPMFKEYRDDAGKVRLDRETAAIIQQREPDWRRQFSMTLYLAKRRRHKFPPLLLVVTQRWVDEPGADDWDGTGRALRDSVNVNSLDSLGRFVDLHLADEDLLFAIDGQHRLMALQGLADLLSTGRLAARGKDGETRTLTITIDEIVENSKERISRTDLQQLLAERIGIEIIPAVLKGETRHDALRRLRSIFVHVNRTAVPLTKGELALLDEDDGFAVVARLVVVEHGLLKNRVQLKKGQLLPSAAELTTLETVVAIARSYLGQFGEYASWKPDTKTEMAMRPEEESLDSGYRRLAEYFSAMEGIPSYKRVMQGGSAKALREDEGNILFRPMVQIALAEALGTLVAEKQRKLSTLIEMLSAKENEGLLSCNEPSSPWFGVVNEPLSKNMRRTEAARNLCCRLLIHVLGGGTNNEKVYEELKSDFANSRLMDVEKNYAVDLKGQQVPLEKVEPPSPW